MASTYSTWEYYTGVHGGAAGENEYARLAKKAAAEIDHQTFGRAKTAEESMQGALCECECELVDALFSFEGTAALIPAGINSISNDGLAVTAAGDTATKRDTELYRICRKFLCAPYNLMYAGVVPGC